MRMPLLMPLRMLLMLLMPSTALDYDTLSFDLKPVVYIQRTTRVRVKEMLMLIYIYMYNVVQPEVLL